MTWFEMLYLALQVSLAGAFLYLLAAVIRDHIPPRP